MSLAFYLPRVVATTVGGFSTLWSETTTSAATTIAAPSATLANLNNLQVATTVEANLASSFGAAHQASAVTPVTSVSISTPPSGLFSSNLMEQRTNNKSISDATLNKLTQALTKTLKKQ